MKNLSSSCVLVKMFQKFLIVSYLERQRYIIMCFNWLKKKSSNETKLNDLVLVIPAYQNVLVNPISLGSSEPVSIKY